MHTTTRLDLAEMERADLEQALEALGHPRFHGRQVLRWMMKRGVTDFAQMSDLSRDLRAELDRACTISTTGCKPS